MTQQQLIQRLPQLLAEVEAFGGKPLSAEQIGHVLAEISEAFKNGTFLRDQLHFLSCTNPTMGSTTGVNNEVGKCQSCT